MNEKNENPPNLKEFILASKFGRAPLGYCPLCGALIVIRCRKPGKEYYLKCVDKDCGYISKTSKTLKEARDAGAK